MLDKSTKTSLAIRAIDNTVGDPPLCVDLDGTLLLTDVFHEQLLKIAREAPSCLARLLPRLGAGKAAFKRAIAEAAGLNLASLPENTPLVAWLRTEVARGREVALVSAADQAVVDAVAHRFPGLFAWTRGSDGAVNLSGERKLAAIRARYGDRFAYIGDDASDLPIWRAASGVVMAGRGTRLTRRLSGVPIEAAFARPFSITSAWRRALRPHQWAKNLLVFVPVLLAGPLADAIDYAEALVGFLIFGLLASAGYVINDLLDLEADRQHRSKRERPFAAGALTPREGVLGAGLMLLAVVGACVLMPSAFTLIATFYFAGTLAYSLGLKRIALLDVLALAGLFTTRILAGAVLPPTALSFWLLTFSMFIFSSLAFVKRYAELAAMMGQDTPSQEPIAGRGYDIRDLPLLLPLGVLNGHGRLLNFRHLSC